MITAMDIYQAFPRKCARLYALKCIEKAMENMTPGELLRRVELYAKHCRGKDAQYIPHPSTWFNQGRYFDIDDDPKCWPIPPEVSSEQAWSMVLETVRNVGISKSPRDQLPGVVYAAVSKVGWAKLCDINDYTRAEVRKQFVAIYEQVATEDNHGRSGTASDGDRRQTQDGTRR